MAIDIRYMALAAGVVVFDALPMLNASTAHAQGYPRRGVTIVVPFAAGGPTDRVARDLAESMRKPLGAISVATARAEDTSKPWNVSASLRGFYDDNWNTAPSHSATPPFRAATL